MSSNTDAASFSSWSTMSSNTDTASVSSWSSNTDAASVSSSSSNTDAASVSSSSSNTDAASVSSSSSNTDAASVTSSSTISISSSESQTLVDVAPSDNATDNADAALPPHIANADAALPPHIANADAALPPHTANADAALHPHIANADAASPSQNDIDYAEDAPPSYDDYLKTEPPPPTYDDYLQTEPAPPPYSDIHTAAPPPYIIEIRTHGVAPSGHTQINIPAIWGNGCPNCCKFNFLQGKSYSTLVGVYIPGIAVIYAFALVLIILTLSTYEATCAKWIFWSLFLMFFELVTSILMGLGIAKYDTNHKLRAIPILWIFWKGIQVIYWLFVGYNQWWGKYLDITADCGNILTYSLAFLSIFPLITFTFTALVKGK